MMNRWVKTPITALAVIFGILAISWSANVIVSAIAQSPGQVKLQSLVGPLGLSAQGPGPTSSYLLVTGGTLVCTGGGTITVTNANVDAGSAIILTLKTVGGTVAQPFIATITAGTGFSVTCGGSDTSTYNYVVVG